MFCRRSQHKTSIETQAAGFQVSQTKTGPQLASAVAVRVTPGRGLGCHSGDGKGEKLHFFPSVSNTRGFGSPPQNETSTMQAALHLSLNILELTPGRGTQIHHIFILNFARPHH